MTDLAKTLTKMYKFVRESDEGFCCHKPEHRIDAMLKTDEGQSLAALVEAAEAWRDEWVPVVPDGASSPPDMNLLRAFDAYREEVMSDLEHDQ
jgi:hypothetical protein